MIIQDYAKFIKDEYLKIDRSLTLFKTLMVETRGIEPLS
ncbi:MAG: Unknown protein [uncultured Sulfurovum sp.]|uniref:Uncharacterized protein n=1 Tax=uncultured Sulfurovum sp. TaxID=269237 RepID=A0A6S6TGH0_9BACT|nr:MAG: Unknown protein [uncultured Sulfurovum sp.]